MLYLDIDRGSILGNPASSYFTYASRTLDIDHSPRKATDENDTGIVVTDEACTAPPFRTPFARCSSFVSTPSAPMVSALTIAVRSSGRVRPPPLPPRVMVTCLCKRMRKKEVRNHREEVQRYQDVGFCDCFCLSRFNAFARCLLAHYQRRSECTPSVHYYVVSRTPTSYVGTTT